MEQPNGIKKFAYLKSLHGSQENIRRWHASASLHVWIIRENIS
jgi:hypothetical protein